MLRYMLDTNICVHVMRKADQSVVEKLKQHHGTLSISVITLHELIHGAEKSARPEKHRQRVEMLTAGFAILDFDTEAAAHSGQIHATLIKKGQLIGAYDMLIAGHARSLGLTVVTNNLKEFTRVQGLRCEDWLGEAKETP